VTTTPLTPEKWLEILRAEGVKVAEFPGWRTNERDQATGKPFGPVFMILNHHTAGSASLNVVAKGRAGLPGPLAHAHLNKRGLVTMVSAGRANHAGLMAKNAFESFVEEDDRHPRPDASTGTVDGNDVSYGIEVENLGDGEDTYTREQYDAWVRFDAAVARHHLWTENSAGMHSETSVEGKIDPKGPVAGYGARGRFTFSGNQFRQDVAERLRHPASWNPGQTEAPVTDAERKNPTYSAVVEADAVPAPRNHPDTATNPFWTMESYLRFIAESLIRIEEKLK
jgi:hypothetical protein